jgi:hypothetical protein
MVITKTRSHRTLSFIIEIVNSLHDPLSNLINENEDRKNGKESYPSKIIFISLTKILKDHIPL